MDFYFIVQVKIKDEKEYQKYIKGADEVFKKYKGKYLAVDNSPLVIEGNYDYTRTVIISFKSKDDFDAWYNSDDYQKILKYRLNGAHCDSILVEGLSR